MTAKELIATFEGQEVGRIEGMPNGRHQFTYANRWRKFSGAIPLSLSLPLAASAHEHEAITAFIWGLLPDNEQILSRWSKRFQVSPRNPFALIANVGEECAGAFQFVRPENFSSVQKTARPEIDWVTEADIARRIQELREDISAWRGPSDRGQFSLAGAQPKTAFLSLNGKWGIPSGRMPTTHILKPPTADFDGHNENEHVCLRLAQELGLPAANSKIVHFKSETAIVIERYDRASTKALSAAAATEAAAFAARAAAASTPQEASDAAISAAAAAARASMLGELSRSRPILRLHQEDLCQALAVLPTAKYQNEGGPSPERIIELFRLHSSAPVEDVTTFVDALGFNWLIAGTDAHAKNYALLHGEGGRVRLAPLYDLASALPYPNLNPRKMNLAMKIGGEYRLENIAKRHWMRFAESIRVDPEATVARIARMAEALPERLAAALRPLRAAGPAHPILARIETALIARSRSCLALLRRA